MTRRKTVVYSSDGRDSDRLLVSIASVRRYIGNDVRIVILTEQAPFDGFADVEYVNPMPVFLELGFDPSSWDRKWPFSALFRLALPFLEPFKDDSQVVYLDTDVLLRSPFARTLFNWPDDRYECIAAPDGWLKQDRRRRSLRNDICPEAREALKPLWARNPPDSRHYINSGVMVWNLAVIRRSLAFYRQRLVWLDDCIRRGKFRFIDQDFINVFMDTDASLGRMFNRFSGDHNTRCFVQHFVGKTKRNMFSTAKAIGLCQ